LNKLGIISRSEKTPTSTDSGSVDTEVRWTKNTDTHRYLETIWRRWKLRWIQFYYAVRPHHIHRKKHIIALYSIKNRVAKSDWVQWLVSRACLVKVWKGHKYIYWKPYKSTQWRKNIFI